MNKKLWQKLKYLENGKSFYDEIKSIFHYFKGDFNQANNNFKLRQALEVGKEVPVLSERIKKKDSLGKFYMASTENRPYFNKDIIFSIESRKNLEEKYFYWLKNIKTRKKNKNGFWRQKLYSLSGNFI